jgi:hypothetical protein
MIELKDIKKGVIIQFGRYYIQYITKTTKTTVHYVDLWSVDWVYKTEYKHPFNNPCIYTDIFCEEL